MWWFLVFLLLCISYPFTNIIRAQHQPLLSQYMLNKFLFNPALSGLKDQTVLTAGYRNQWVGIEGAPKSYYLTGHTALGGDNPSQHWGVGGTIFSDRIGPLRTTTLSLSGAYHILLSDGFHLSGGLSFGLLQRHLDVHSFDPIIANDPALYQGFTNTLNPYLGMGLWGFSDHFFAGISTIQAPNQEIQSELANSPINIRHYFVNAGGILPLWRKQRLRQTENYLMLIPSFLARFMPSASPVYDINLRLVYKDFLMVGGSYRSTQDFVLQLGAEWPYRLSPSRKNVAPSYFFSYSYDFGSSAQGLMSSGTHEITLGIRLHRNRIDCPLFERSPMYFF